MYSEQEYRTGILFVEQCNYLESHVPFPGKSK